MAITKSTLASLQKTSASAQSVRMSLQAEARKYSDRLSKALAANATGDAFDLLDGPEIANWKSVGKLSKMIEAIEAELAAALKFASDLVIGASATNKKAPAVKPTKVKTAAKKRVPNTKADTARGGENAKKLLAILDATLSSNEFSKLKQTELAKASSIPLGSMTAALKKLTKSGDIVLGKDGGYKLGKSASAPADPDKVADARVKVAAKARTKVKTPSESKNVADKTATKNAAKTDAASAKPVTKAASKKAPARKTAQAAKAEVTAAPQVQIDANVPAAVTVVQDVAADAS